MTLDLGCSSCPNDTFIFHAMLHNCIDTRELDDEVIDGHIHLYVNDFSISLGDTGMKAIKTLGRMAEKLEIF